MTEAQIRQAMKEYDQYMTMVPWAELFGFQADWGMENGQRFIEVDGQRCEVGTASEGLWALAALMGKEIVEGR